MISKNRAERNNTTVVRLSEMQKYQLITILRDLAAIDHNFDLWEAVRIRLIGLKLDLHEAKIDEALAEDFERMPSIKLRLEHFPEEPQKKFLYQQCVLLLITNREVTVEEQKAMDEIRLALGLNEEFHQQILVWAKEGMEWEKRGEQLVGGALEE